MRLCRKGLHDKDVTGRDSGGACRECRRVRHRARGHTPERRAYERARYQTPERLAYFRARYQTPEHRAALRAYSRSPLGRLAGYLYRVRTRIAAKEARLQEMTNGS